MGRPRVSQTDPSRADSEQSELSGVLPLLRVKIITEKLKTTLLPAHLEFEDVVCSQVERQAGVGRRRAGRLQSGKDTE